MNLLAIRLPEMIGLTILHSLWQITLLWIVLVTALRLLPKASSGVRYTLAISTLVLSVLATTATAVYEWESYTTGEDVSALSNGIAQTMSTVVITTVKQSVLSTIANALNASVPILAWLWCAGLVVMGTRFGGSFFYLKTLRAQENITPISPFWKQELKRLSSTLDLRCEVAIATSSGISSPLTLGSVSPIILLPVGILSGLSTAQIEAILVHELYHIKRRDYIINICQALVEVVLFYHPAIWHINKIIREERENCCDDQTVAYCGDAIAYARALTQIQEINSLTKPSLAMSATGPNAGNFTNRIKRLFHIYPNPAQTRSKGIFAIGFLIVYLCIVLASSNLSTARPIELEKKPWRTSVNDHDAFNNIFSDSIIVSNPLDILDEKEPIPQKLWPVAGPKIRSTDIQRADTTESGQSLQECGKKIRAIFNLASILIPKDGLRFSKFSAEDSLRIASSMDYRTKPSLHLQPIRFYNKLHLTDNTNNETTKDIIPEKIHEASVEETTVHDSQAIDRYGDEETDDTVENTETSIDEFTKEVQVFPNSTNGILNIRLAPARNDSRITMNLVDSNGELIKEITNSIYDSTPVELQVDLSGYKKGFYILQISINGAKSQQKLVLSP